MSLKRDIGIDFKRLDAQERSNLISYINLKLAGMGLPVYSKEGIKFLDLASDMLANYRERGRLLAGYLPPSDARIQSFLDSYLSDLPDEEIPRLPSQTLVLDRYGMARELSLPPKKQEYSSPTLSSYRVRNGVLHNPASDRRTTEGVFHIAEGGLPVPLDKKAVPKLAFARLLKKAFNPPEDLLVLPFCADEREKARVFLSMLLRPIVRPEVQNYSPEQSMEVRFFAPASLAANLDFVESIYGNSGDPYVATNDAALDPLSWTGHSGCIVLATHLAGLRKKELGLPQFKDATERQKNEGMCWKNEDELYNDGQAFKICARDERGVIVTIIADNYFGYSKKEIKTHISYSSNLLGQGEEEHAGGALVVPSYNLGTRFVPDTNLNSKGQSIDTVLKILGNRIEFQPDGYAIDSVFPKIIYLPEDASISLDDQEAHWFFEGKARSLRVLPGEIYIHPTGYQISLDRHPGTGSWRLVGRAAEGLLCHKPCTVSGGGKSEISKLITDAMSDGPIVTADYREDMALVREIIEKDYSGRFARPSAQGAAKSRPVLSSKRSLGSVIKLLSPSSLYNSDYNEWLTTIPERIKSMVFMVKRFYRDEWGDRWEEKFSTDHVNGDAGNVIKYNGRPVQASFLRVGFTEDGQRSLHKVRQDYMPAKKIQWEDDISASVFVPVKALSGLPEDAAAADGLCVKFTKNCETRFFQRPDDAIQPGYDKQAESDLGRMDNFISNFEPLTRARAFEMLQKTVNFSEYTEPMQAMIRDAESDERFQYFVVSSHPRMVNGKPSKNPRYLQLDSNYIKPMDRYIVDIAARLYRGVESDRPVYHPVGAVLPGRRNNPPEPEAGIRPLAVYSPIHYQELPELFMDFISSLTGKSPSTTGAGSEGALTKGPFNALLPTADLNLALLGFILAGYDGYSTAAGFIGHKYRVDHDISLLVPELWSRLSPEERDPDFLIANGYLERVNDFEWQGKTVPAGRLGYRITPLFASHFLGRIFDAPGAVFTEEILRPELQSIENFADGVLNIAEAQEKTARNYFDDGSIQNAIPPLLAILHIMAWGHWEGKNLDSAELRQLFDRDEVIKSQWYKDRIDAFVRSEELHLKESLKYLEGFLANTAGRDGQELHHARTELENVKKRILYISTKEYRESLVGTAGMDPCFLAKKENK